MICLHSKMSRKNNIYFFPHYMVAICQPRIIKAWHFGATWKVRSWRWPGLGSEWEKRKIPQNGSDLHRPYLNVDQHYVIMYSCIVGSSVTQTRRSLLSAYMCLAEQRVAQQIRRLTASVAFQLSAGWQHVGECHRALCVQQLRKTLDSLTYVAYLKQPLQSVETLPRHPLPFRRLEAFFVPRNFLPLISPSDSEQTD